MAYISLRHVGKRYQMGEITITAVDDISFEIEKGQFAVIVGPSGAGKTTDVYKRQALAYVAAVVIALLIGAALLSSMDVDPLTIFW